MTEKLIIAGFGGQGIMLIGQILSYAAMMAEKSVSWLPSYGPEMRGGTAHCHVIVSSESVDSPLVSQATTAMALNEPSMLKFEQQLSSNGVMLVNASLIQTTTKRQDIRTLYIPANEIALRLGNPKIANMVMLGAYLQLTQIVAIENIKEALIKVLGESKLNLVEINLRALKEGAAFSW